MNTARSGRFGHIDALKGAGILLVVFGHLIEKPSAQSVLLQTLYIDISSAVLSDHDTVRKLFKMMDGITYMGCSVVVTGLRPEVAVMLIELDLALNERIQIKSTLRQAMEELGICEH